MSITVLIKLRKINSAQKSLFAGGFKMPEGPPMAVPTIAPLYLVNFLNVHTQSFADIFISYGINLFNRQVFK